MAAIKDYCYHQLRLLTLDSALKQQNSRRLAVTRESSQYINSGAGCTMLTQSTGTNQTPVKEDPPQ